MEMMLVPRKLLEEIEGEISDTRYHSEELCQLLKSGKNSPEYVLYGYITPSGKLYASGMLAIANGEQSWVKVYVNKEDLK